MLQSVDMHIKYIVFVTTCNIPFKARYHWLKLIIGFVLGVFQSRMWSSLPVPLIAMMFVIVSVEPGSRYVQKVVAV